MQKINKLLGPKYLAPGIVGLVLVGVLAFALYQPVAPKVGAGPKPLAHSNSKIAAASAQVLGASITKPTNSPNNSSGTRVIVAPPSNNASQPVTVYPNDPPIGPPPPVVCHIYDVCGAQPADEQQGIYGIITRGPITPVCRVDIPCDGPYQTTMIVSNSEGPVTQFTSAGDGSFRVDLLPGSYKITPASADRFSRESVYSVTVVFGIYSQLDISFDTGIR